VVVREGCKLMEVLMVNRLVAVLHWVLCAGYLWGEGHSLADRWVSAGLWVVFAVIVVWILAMVAYSASL